jgi:transposase InsO family protein
MLDSTRVHRPFCTYYGSEFAGQAMDAWAHQAGVKLDFIRPGRPVQNGYIESFNGRLRDETDVCYY